MTKAPWETPMEQLLFASRWLMAPFYVGMVAALGAVLFVFLRELASDIMRLLTLNTEGVIMLALSLIDLSLTGNLLLMVIFSGYENFVSKIDTGRHEDRPSWMGTVDFSGLKLKLIASIVAISAIALLRAFLPLADPGSHETLPSDKLAWMTGIHATFVVSGVLLAAMDWIVSKTERHAAPSSDHPAPPPHD